MFCEHLGSPPVLFCGVSLAHVFSFLCYVSCFVCLCPVSCVINVASVSGLSILDCPFSFLCCVCCFVCLCPVSCVPNVAVSLDCPFLIASSVFSNAYSLMYVCVCFSRYTSMMYLLPF